MWQQAAACLPVRRACSSGTRSALPSEQLSSGGVELLPAVHTPGGEESSYTWGGSSNSGGGESGIMMPWSTRPLPSL